mgnify:CR=1 FL=1
MLNLHLLECTVKGYDHISDLLLAKYWVITCCKYEDCTKLIIDEQLNNRILESNKENEKTLEYEEEVVEEEEIYFNFY